MRKQGWMLPFFGLALVLSIVLGVPLLISYPAVWNPIHHNVMEERFIEQGVTGERLDLMFSDAENISGGLWNETPYQ